jgi:hypothetical protein
MISARQQAWFALSPSDSTALRCAACANEVDLGSTADHHPRVCPACGVESAFLNWKGRTVQIVMRSAPRTLAEAIRWSQQNLDELEYAELLCAFEEIADAVNGLGARK